MLDFPSTPTLNQKYPQPAVAGQPVYVWDGEKWTTVGGAIGGKTPIYTDGSQAMTAQLTVVNPPVNPTDATAKGYVDSADANMLKYSAQSLTTAQQSQARTNINAAQYEVAAYNGLQINSGMELSQEFGTSSTAIAVGVNKYLVDQWMFYFYQSPLVAVFNGQLIGTPPNGFRNCLGITATTGWTPNIASALASLFQYIEGLRWAKLRWGTIDAVPVTISFWVYSVATGTMSVSITNGANANRSYVTPVTINATTTWEYKQVIIPGDTTGTWATDNSAAARLAFCFGSGASFVTAPNVWTAGNFYGHTGVSNFFAANSNAVFVTGVTIMPGNVGPTAAQSPMMMRPYPEEEILAMRYYEKMTWTMVNSVTIFDNSVMYKVRKRAVPTLTHTALNGATVGDMGGSGQVGVQQLSAATGAVGNTTTANARLL